MELEDDDMTPSLSRVGIPSPAPIVFEGKRYEQILNGELEGLHQRTGLMEVMDMTTGARLAVVRIYDFPRELVMEADVGDVFFIATELDIGRREILIENERHQRFAYAIDGGAVRALP